MSMLVPQYRMQYHSASGASTTMSIVVPQFRMQYQSARGISNPVSNAVPECERYEYRPTWYKRTRYPGTNARTSLCAYARTETSKPQTLDPRPWTLEPRLQTPKPRNP
eukprot:3757705-Rhodomonas_salina.1